MEAPSEEAEGSVICALESPPWRGYLGESLRWGNRKQCPGEKGGDGVVGVKGLSHPVVEPYVVTVASRLGVSVRDSLRQLSGMAVLESN